MREIETRIPASFGGVPFIWHKMPFIRRKVASDVPNIGFILPFVWSRSFYRQNNLAQKGAAGFTLVELVIAVVIVGILAAFAIPAMQSVILDARLSTQANEMLADLQFARTEAIRRNASVAICKSTNPTAASPTCNPTSTDPWTTGRVIFVDLNNDGVIDPGETVLRSRSPLDGGSNKLIGDGSVAGTANVVRFVPQGLAPALVATDGACIVTPQVPPTENQWMLCDRRGVTQARAIVMNRNGRARIGDKGKDKYGTTLTSGSCAACPTS